VNDDMNTPRSEGDAFGAPMEPIGPETAAAAPTDATAQPSPEPVGGDPGASDSWQPSWKTWVAVGVGAAAVGAAAVFGISAATSSGSSDAAVSTEAGSGATGGAGGTGTAQSPGAQRGFAGGPGGFGTIATIDGSSLTIEDASGTTTKVVTTDDTTVTVSVEGSVDDIAVGDTVMVFGEGTSTIAATRVTSSGEVSDADQGPPGGFRNGTPPQMPDGQAPPGGMNGTPPQMPDGQAPPNGQGPGGPGGAGMGGVRGVVKSVGDGTFTVTGMDDTEVTVTTSSSTEVTITKAATLGDLEVGDSVMVIGTEADGTLTATSIREGGFGGPPGMVPGAGSTPGNDPQQ
jgi:hypothetical protein